MQKINLRDLYPDIYKTDIFLEVTDEVHAVFWQTNELTLPMSARCIAIRHTILWTMTMALKMP